MHAFIFIFASMGRGEEGGVSYLLSKSLCKLSVPLRHESVTIVTMSDKYACSRAIFSENLAIQLDEQHESKNTSPV